MITEISKELVRDTYSSKIESLSVDIDRRFNIFNMSMATQFRAQEMLNKEYTKLLDKQKKEINYLNWYISIPLYKKLWWKIINKNFKDIWNNLN